MIRSTAIICLTLALTGSASAGDVTQASIMVGGPGSCSSEGFNDPGLLADGITEASATYDFTLDAGTATLTLEVTNTSPVLAGVPNPVLTLLYFNAPMSVTGMTLDNQTSSGGDVPAYALTFDADLLSNPNPNGADGFGAFSVELANTNGVNGAISNPLADTLAPSSSAVSPVTFTFTLSGGAGFLDGVTAEDFTNIFSVIPPGTKPTHAVGHFQAGGVDESSAYISDDPEECFLVLGDGPGLGTFENPGPGTVEFETSVGELMQVFGATLTSLPMIRLDVPRSRTTSRNHSPGLVGVGGFSEPVQVYWAQMLMWNPEVFPGNPEQWSTGLRVAVWPDGSVTTMSYGSANGMSVSADLFDGPDGNTYLRFPFLIDDL